MKTNLSFVNSNTLTYFKFENIEAQNLYLFFESSDQQFQKEVINQNLKIQNNATLLNLTFLLFHLSLSKCSLIFKVCTSVFFDNYELKQH